MEILFILSLGIAFYWFMLETKWLSVRLERTPEKGVIDISGILKVAIGMVFLAVGFIIAPIRIYRSHTYTEKEHEEDMVKLWKYYGRKQPERIT